MRRGKASRARATEKAPIDSYGKLDVSGRVVVRQRFSVVESLSVECDKSFIFENCSNEQHSTQGRYDAAKEEQGWCQHVCVDVKACCQCPCSLPSATGFVLTLLTRLHLAHASEGAVVMSAEKPSFRHLCGVGHLLPSQGGREIWYHTLPYHTAPYHRHTTGPEAAVGQVLKENLLPIYCEH